MSSAELNHYAVLGLEPDCTLEQIRAAYRFLVKQHHPDRNPNSPEALAQIQAINLAHEILSEPSRRAAYDRELAAIKSVASRGGRSAKISQDLHLRIEELLNGTTREVRVQDSVNSAVPEIYKLTIPPLTPPGARFRIERSDSGGVIEVRIKAMPDFRFKIRGFDLRCDLKIRPDRAAKGGIETIKSATGSLIRVQIPAGVERGATVRILDEGLPKPRGGRGDLLVRIVYRPEIRVVRRQGG